MENKEFNLSEKIGHISNDVSGLCYCKEYKSRDWLIKADDVQEFIKKLQENLKEDFKKLNDRQDNSIKLDTILWEVKTEIDKLAGDKLK